MIAQNRVGAKSFCGQFSTMTCIRLYYLSLYESCYADPKAKNDALASHSIFDGMIIRPLHTFMTYHSSVVDLDVNMLFLAQG